MFRFFKLYSLYVKKMSQTQWCLCEKLPRAVLQIPLNVERRCELCGLLRRPRCPHSSSSDEEGERRQRMLAERRRIELACKGPVRIKVAMSAKKPKQGKPETTMTPAGKTGKVQTGRFGQFKKPKRMPMAAGIQQKTRAGADTQPAEERQTKTLTQLPSKPPAPAKPKPKAKAMESLWEQPNDNMPNLVAMAHEVFNRPLHLRQRWPSYYNNMFISDLIPLDSPITDPAGGAITKQRGGMRPPRVYKSRPMPPLSKVLADIIARRTHEEQLEERATAEAQRLVTSRETGGGHSSSLRPSSNCHVSQFWPFERYDGPSEDALVVDSARSMLLRPTSLYIEPRPDLRARRLPTVESGSSSSGGCSSPQHGTATASAPSTDLYYSAAQPCYYMRTPCRLNEETRKTGTQTQARLSVSSSSSSSDSGGSAKKKKSSLKRRPTSFAKHAFTTFRMRGGKCNEEEAEAEAVNVYLEQPQDLTAWQFPSPTDEPATATESGIGLDKYLPFWVLDDETSGSKATASEEHLEEQLDELFLSSRKWVSSTEPHYKAYSMERISLISKFEAQAKFQELEAKNQSNQLEIEMELPPIDLGCDSEDSSADTQVTILESDEEEVIKADVEASKIGKTQSEAVIKARRAAMRKMSNELHVNSTNKTNADQMYAKVLSNSGPKKERIAKFSSKSCVVNKIVKKQSRELSKRHDTSMWSLFVDMFTPAIPAACGQCGKTRNGTVTQRAKNEKQSINMLPKKQKVVATKGTNYSNQKPHRTKDLNATGKFYKAQTEAKKSVVEKKHQCFRESQKSRISQNMKTPFVIPHKKESAKQQSCQKCVINQKLQKTNESVLTQANGFNKLKTQKIQQTCQKSVINQRNHVAASNPSPGNHNQRLLARAKDPSKPRTIASQVHEVPHKCNRTVPAKSLPEQQLHNLGCKSKPTKTQDKTKTKATIETPARCLCVIPKTAINRKFITLPPNRQIYVVEGKRKPTSKDHQKSLQSKTITVEYLKSRIVSDKSTAESSSYEPVDTSTEQQESSQSKETTVDVSENSTAESSSYEPEETITDQREYLQCKETTMEYLKSTNVSNNSTAESSSYEPEETITDQREYLQCKETTVEYLKSTNVSNNSTAESTSYEPDETITDQQECKENTVEYLKSTNVSDKSNAESSSCELEETSTDQQEALQCKETTVEYLKSTNVSDNSNAESSRYQTCPEAVATPKGSEAIVEQETKKITFQETRVAIINPRSLILMSPVHQELQLREDLLELSESEDIEPQQRYAVQIFETVQHKCSELIIPKMVAFAKDLISTTSTATWQIRQRISECSSIDLFEFRTPDIWPYELATGEPRETIERNVFPQNREVEQETLNDELNVCIEDFGTDESNPRSKTDLLLNGQQLCGFATPIAHNSTPKLNLTPLEETSIPYVQLKSKKRRKLTEPPVWPAHPFRRKKRQIYYEAIDEEIEPSNSVNLRIKQPDHTETEQDSITAHEIEPLIQPTIEFISSDKDEQVSVKSIKSEAGSLSSKDNKSFISRSEKNLITARSDFLQQRLLESMMKPIKLIKSAAAKDQKETAVNRNAVEYQELTELSTTSDPASLNLQSFVEMESVLERKKNDLAVNSKQCKMQPPTFTKPLRLLTSIASARPSEREYFDQSISAPKICKLFADSSSEPVFRQGQSLYRGLPPLNWQMISMEATTPRPVQPQAKVSSNTVENPFPCPVYGCEALLGPETFYEHFSHAHRPKFALNGFFQQRCHRTLEGLPKQLTYDCANLGSETSFVALLTYSSVTDQATRVPRIDEHPFALMAACGAFPNLRDSEQGILIFWLVGFSTPVPLLVKLTVHGARNNVGRTKRISPRDMRALQDPRVFVKDSRQYLLLKKPPAGHSLLHISLVIEERRALTKSICQLSK